MSFREINRATATATRTSSQNINSCSFNHFVTISTFFIGQGCGSSYRMTLVGTALNLGEKMKIYPQVLTSLIKPRIWLFLVVVLQTTAKKWTKMKHASAGCAKLLFCPLNMQIFDVLVAVAIVVV